jgi:hypothetical protein
VIDRVIRVILNISETLYINRLSEMPTLSFKVDTQEQKKYINTWFADLVKSRGELGKKGEALQYIIDQYDLAFKNIRFREVPEDVESLIKEADCQYLKYEPYEEGKKKGTGYVCYEFFSKKKKPSILGTDHDLILSKCNLCKAGKLDLVEQQIQKQLRKKNIKNLLNLREILINLQIEGGIAQIFICKADLLEQKKLVVSTNGTHLPCPLEEDTKDVQVKLHCYNQINPMSMEPPCQYLIDPFVNVKVEPSEKASEILERIALEYQESEPKQDPKIVDVEVIDEEGQPDEEEKEK